MATNFAKVKKIKRSRVGKRRWGQQAADSSWSVFPHLLCSTSPLISIIMTTAKASHGLKSQSPGKSIWLIEFSLVISCALDAKNGRSVTDNGDSRPNGTDNLKDQSPLVRSVIQFDSTIQQSFHFSHDLKILYYGNLLSKQVYFLYWN